MVTRTKPLNLKCQRKRLLQNIDRQVTCCAKTMKYIAVGQAAVAAAEARTFTSTVSNSSAQFVPGPSPDRSDVLILVQATIIQEWQIFLDDVFEAVVRYYLKIGQQSKLSPQSLNVGDIDSSSISNMRKSIARAARERFSFDGYDDRVRRVRKIFGLQGEDNSIGVLKKHVEMRNIFQHNRGEVRDSDLARIGSAHFEIREESEVKTYKAGEEIVLTYTEVECLVETIRTFSEKFEVLT